MIGFPNPANTSVVVSLKNKLFEHTMHISVFNLEGKNVRKISINPNESFAFFNVSNLPGGIYHVVCHDGDNLATQRLIISK